MKFSLVSSLVLLTAPTARPFVVGKGGAISSMYLHSTTTSSTADTVEQKNSAKVQLLTTAANLKERYGLFVTDKEAKATLYKATEDLERFRNTCSKEDNDFIGEWTLLCTCSTNVERPEFFPESPLQSSLTQAFNKYVVVKQIIKGVEGVVDRIDHVIEYETPDQLGSVFPNLPEQLAALKLFNPLQVSKSKLALVHKAKVLETYGEGSMFTTQLDLSSIVLNVAGSSTLLDPNGKDVLGLNVPGVPDNFPFANEFATRAGSFEMTYMDDTVRISRGKLYGVIDQLRVFVRESTASTDITADRSLGESPSTSGESDDLTPSA